MEDAEQKALESALSRLKPNAPDDAFVEALAEKLEEPKEVQPETVPRNKIVYLKLAPLALAACLMLAATIALRYQWTQSSPAATGAVGSDLTEAEVPKATLAPAPEGTLLPASSTSHIQGGLVPVSMDKTVESALDQGIISPDGQVPLRQIDLRIQHSLRLYDEDTQTDIHVQYPEEETILVPEDTY